MQDSTHSVKYIEATVPGDMGLPWGLVMVTVLGVAALAGCTFDPSSGFAPTAGSPCERFHVAAAGLVMPVAATPPTPPLENSMEVCNPEAFFGDGSRVVVELRVWTNGPEHVVAGIRLPPNVAVVSGSLDFDGTTAAGGRSSIVLEAVLRGPPGEHEVVAWAELPSWATNGSRMAPEARLRITGDESQATIDTNFACCPRPPWRFALTAQAENPSAVEATVSADVSWQGHAMLWTGAELVGGWKDTTFDLAAGEELRLRDHVRLPDDFIQMEYGGYYQIALFVYPDPTVSGSMIEKSLYYGMRDGQLVVLEHLPND